MPWGLALQGGQELWVSGVGVPGLFLPIGPCTPRVPALPCAPTLWAWDDMGHIVEDSPSSIPVSHYTPCLLPVEPQKVPQPLPQEGQERDSGVHTEGQGRTVPIR